MNFVFAELSRVDHRLNEEFLLDLDDTSTLCQNVFHEDLKGYLTWARGKSASKAESPYYGFDFIVILRNKANHALGFAFMTKKNPDLMVNHIDMFCAQAGYGNLLLRGVTKFCKIIYADKDDYTIPQVTLECAPNVYGFWRSMGFTSPTSSSLDAIWDRLEKEVEHQAKSYYPGTLASEPFFGLLNFYKNLPDPVRDRDYFRNSFLRSMKRDDRLLVAAMCILHENEDALHEELEHALPKKIDMVKQITYQDVEKVQFQLHRLPTATDRRAEPPTKSGRLPQKRKLALESVLDGFQEGDRKAARQKGTNVSSNQRRHQVYKY